MVVSPIATGMPVVGAGTGRSTSGGLAWAGRDVPGGSSLGGGTLKAGRIVARLVVGGSALGTGGTLTACRIRGRFFFGVSAVGGGGALKAGRIVVRLLSGASSIVGGAALGNAGPGGSAMSVSLSSFAPVRRSVLRRLLFFTVATQRG